MASHTLKDNKQTLQHSWKHYILLLLITHAKITFERRDILMLLLKNVRNIYKLGIYMYIRDKNQLANSTY